MLHVHYCATARATEPKLYRTHYDRREKRERREITDLLWKWSIPLVISSHCSRDNKTNSTLRKKRKSKNSNFLLLLNENGFIGLHDWQICMLGKRRRRKKQVWGKSADKISILGTLIGLVTRYQTRFLLLFHFFFFLHFPNYDEWTKKRFFLRKF